MKNKTLKNYDDGLTTFVIDSIENVYKQKEGATVIEITFTIPKSPTF